MTTQRAPQLQARSLAVSLRPLQAPPPCRVGQIEVSERGTTKRRIQTRGCLISAAHSTSGREEISRPPFGRRCAQPCLHRFKLTRSVPRQLETEHRHKLAEKRPPHDGDAGPPVLSYTSRRAQATGAAALAAAAPERPMLQPFVARPSVPSTAGTAPSPAPPSAAPRPAAAALAPTPAAAPLAPYVSSRAAHVAVAAPHRDVPSRPAPAPAPPAPPPAKEPAVAKVALSEAMQRKREELIKRAQGLVRTYPSVDMALN